MGNSDNVLRAGLTEKHIDIPELLSVVDPSVEVPVLRPDADAEGIRRYDAPVDEFALYGMELTGARVELPGAGPRIVLVTEGEVTLTGADGEIMVRRGESAFIPADSAPVFTEPGSRGTMFVATSGLPVAAPVVDRADLPAEAALGGAGHRRGGTSRRVGTRVAAR